MQYTYTYIKTCAKLTPSSGKLFHCLFSHKLLYATCFTLHNFFIKTKLVSLTNHILQLSKFTHFNIFSLSHSTPNRQSEFSFSLFLSQLQIANPNFLKRHYNGCFNQSLSFHQQTDHYSWPHLCYQQLCGSPISWGDAVRFSHYSRILSLEWNWLCFWKS